MPETWKLSRTRMIRKTDKPTVRDFRPIAIIEASCKIYFTFLKRGMRGEWVGCRELDGVYRVGRVEFNHLFLQYAVNRTFASSRRKKEMLVVVAIDFKKAFDSIDRGRLVEVMVRYRIHPQVIDIILRVYTGPALQGMKR